MGSPAQGCSGGGSSFDITTVPKICWFKADASTYSDTGAITPATADGTSVGSWLDQSPMGVGFCSAPSTKPVLKTNIQNGKPVLRFSSAELTTPAMNMPRDGCCIFFVCARPWQTNGAFHGLLGQNTGSNFSLYLATSNASDWLTKWLCYGGGSASSTPPRVIAYTSLVANSFHVFCVRLGTVCDWRVDGVSVVTTKVLGVTTEGSFPLRIGQEGSASYFDGDLAELMIVPGNLDGSTVSSIERYLGTSYGIGIS